MITKITETMDEICELMHEAKEHSNMAIRWREDSPTLSNAFHDCAYALEAQAEKLYTSLKECAEKEKMDDEMKAIWDYHKMRYLNKMAKVKTLHSLYSKM